jgi:hypothetical protein
MFERLKWRIASLVNGLRNQCWTDLVNWVYNDESIRDTGVKAALPWRPIGESCRKDAERASRCYCGKVGFDGTVLGRGEFVCPTPMPSRPNDRMCSLPNGHDGMHRCGEVRWARVNTGTGA